MSKTHHRTARVALRVTTGQRRRCLGLMASGGDVWAWVLDCNRQLRAWRCPQVVNYQALCRELSGSVFGELDQQGARSVLKRYSAAFFEAAKRRAQGEPAGFPRRKRRLFPIRWYHGTFSIEDDRIRLPVARSRPPLWVRLSRPLPYPTDAIRSVTLVHDAGKLCLDVTATVPVADNDLDPKIVAGIDVGIIHPFAIASADDALVVSGRAIRAEERLHLEDSKRRQQKIAHKAPKRGQRGSRRYRKLKAKQRRAEARHRRRVRHAHHVAAKMVIDWAIKHRVGTLVVGNLKGITAKDSGRHHNLRMYQWRRTHLLQALRDKAEVAGMALVLVDERGTSSTCPRCCGRATPQGRNFFCSKCGFFGHRDVVGATNIAIRGGGNTRASPRVTHRRAGKPPARRDRRRHLFDARRSCTAPGRPGLPGSRSLGRRRDGSSSAATAPQPSTRHPVRIEETLSKRAKVS
jgi:IS605 OrfB family transposase